MAMSSISIATRTSDYLMSVISAGVTACTLLSTKTHQSAGQQRCR
jgi:hypothetical protein